MNTERVSPKSTLTSLPRQQSHPVLRGVLHHRKQQSMPEFKAA